MYPTPKLKGKQYQRLRDALASAFTSYKELDQMTEFGEVINLTQEIGGVGSPIKDVAFDLLRWTEARDLTGKLLVAALSANPTSLLLKEVATELLSETSLFDQAEGGLERIIKKAEKFTNVETYLKLVGESVLTVCRVEAPTKDGPGFGTGFLLGPNLVMTNHHVVEDVIEDPALSPSVILRFDYKTSTNGKTTNPGVEYRLAEGWLVDGSPVKELDYALLRLEEDAGEEELGIPGMERKRGWLKVKSKAHKFMLDEPLIILQHPDTQPMKISQGTVVKVKEAQNRVVYTANTLRGSSGSPCFNYNWEVVALHHCGGAGGIECGDPGGNQGVNFAAILNQPKVKAAVGI